MGHQASSIIQPLIQAMSFGLTAPEMARGQYWIHPALPEVVENALLGLSDVSGRRRASWHCGHRPRRVRPARSDSANELPAIACSSAELSCRAGTSMIEPHRVHTAW